MELAAKKKSKGAPSGMKGALAAKKANTVTKQYSAIDGPAGAARAQQPPPSQQPALPAAAVPKLTPYAPNQAPQEYTRQPLPPGRTATVAPTYNEGPGTQLISRPPLPPISK